MSLGKTREPSYKGYYSYGNKTGAKESQVNTTLKPRQVSSYKKYVLERWALHLN
jgi:hypothetical protein